MHMPGEGQVAPTSTVLPQASWDRLAQRRVYFGHQSVGYNILDGVADILRVQPFVRLRVVESMAPRPAEGPALVHSQVGRNCDPGSKMQSFADQVRSGTGSWADVAFFKFCYADIEAGSDIDAIGREYERTMDGLAREFPALQLLHVTVPLRSPANVARRVVKWVLGRTSSDQADNRQREAFNAWLRARYAREGSLLDLARIEATRPDGTLVEGGTALYGGYTSDRSHLNEAGRVVVAGAFLRFLADEAA